jgi:hypothetical protein
VSVVLRGGKTIQDLIQKKENGKWPELMLFSASFSMHASASQQGTAVVAAAVASTPTTMASGFLRFPYSDI